MLKRKLIFIGALCMVLGYIPFAIAASTLKKLGDNPFYSPPLTSVEQLRGMVAKQQDDLKQGFAKAGAPELFPAFSQQFPSATVEAIKVQPGETLQWMLYKKKGKGKVRVVRDVTWGGAQPFEAYRFYIEKDGQRYQFVVPLICSNLSLKDVTPIAAPMNQAPICRMTVSSKKVFSGQEVTADASASSDPDGSVAAVNFKLYDPAGKTVWQNTLNQPPFVQQVTIPGDACSYTLKAMVIDNAGAQSTSPECEMTVAVLRRAFLVADLGFFRQFDPANFLAARVGVEYRLMDGLSVMGLVGGLIKLEDSDDGKNALTVDGLLNYTWSNGFFVGLGVGLFHTEHDDKADLIADVGARVYGDPEAFNISVFLEGRSAFNDFDEIDKYGRFGLGLRFKF